MQTVCTARYYTKLNATTSKPHAPSLSPDPFSFQRYERLTKASRKVSTYTLRILNHGPSCVTQPATHKSETRPTTTAAMCARMAHEQGARNNRRHTHERIHGAPPTSPRCAISNKAQHLSYFCTAEFETSSSHLTSPSTPYSLELCSPMQTHTNLRVCVTPPRESAHASSSTKQIK